MNKTKYKTINEKSKNITDGLGKKIDRGIRELVVLLNYHNIIKTSNNICLILIKLSLNDIFI